VDETDDECSNDHVPGTSSKLKGVFWPGMDLFDSATAEMKRMRNQKKDGTALEQMMQSSMEVEPTEWVFNADGQFRKARDIFDDESSEIGPVSRVSAPCFPSSTQTVDSHVHPLVVGNDIPLKPTATYSWVVPLAVPSSAVTMLDTVKRLMQIG
jgi:hypothetical protein